MAPELQWREPGPIAVPEEFQNAIGGHPLIAETLYRRGIRTLPEAEAFLNPDKYIPASADELPDMQKACSLLAKAIHDRQRILVWGDFDVDGQTSTTLLVKGLRELNADVIYHIPIRAEESHGITAKALQEYLNKGFELLLTCDTGISEHENIQTVCDAGIPVIVTDHHALPQTLPPAAAVINPQRLPGQHPLRTLPGVGVAYKLIEGLHQFLSMPFEPGPFLELVALGIIADVAELKGDTRYLLQRGLVHLRKTARTGLQTLFRNAEINPNALNESQIGFQIAPRLNAIGRLGDANPIVEFLITKDAGRARVIGAQIEAMNAKRRFATRQVERGAEKMLQDSPDDRHASAIVLHHPEWPGGVVGIVASRLVERYQKPAILLTGEDPAHGSARSVEGINITESIGTQADLLTGFGGHPMAAGLSLPASNLSAFKRGLLKEIEEAASRIAFIPEIEINRTIDLVEIDLDLLKTIQRLAPFGPGNPALNFLIRDLRLVSVREVGQTGEHRQVITADESDIQQRFIWWNGADEPLPSAQFDLICQLSQSDYKGAPQISAEWITHRLSARGIQEVQRRKFEISDHRQEPSPKFLLEKLLIENPDLQIWGEGPQSSNLPIRSRDRLEPGGNLAIQTAPPAQHILEDILNQIQPDKVWVFGHDPGLDQFDWLISRVAGLAKYAVNNLQGKTSLTALAGACAATRQTLRNVLQYWAAKGKLEVIYKENEVNIAIASDSEDQQSVRIFREILQSQLAESRAYRQFFATAGLDSIFPEQSNPT